MPAACSRSTSSAVSSRSQRIMPTQAAVGVGDRMHGHRRVGAVHARLHDHAALEPERGIDLEIVLDRSGRRRIAALLRKRKEMRRVDVEMGVPASRRRNQTRLAGIWIRRKRHAQFRTSIEASCSIQRGKSRRRTQPCKTIPVLPERLRMPRTLCRLPAPAQSRHVDGAPKDERGYDVAHASSATGASSRCRACAGRRQAADPQTVSRIAQLQAPTGRQSSKPAPARRASCWSTPWARRSIR